MKFKYQFSFISVILGAVFFGENFDFSLYSLFILLFVYVSFNVFLYGGIYTLNDVFDKKEDSSHPTKRLRPIASGKVSLNSATIFAFILILIGLVSAFLYLGLNIFYLYLSFIVLNLLYSNILKKIPFLELLGNTITHPLRFLLGAAVFGSLVPVDAFLIYSLVPLGFSTARRIFEKKFKSRNHRNTLSYYYSSDLYVIVYASFILLVFFWLIYSPDNNRLFIIGILIYIFAVFGIIYMKRAIPFLKWLWL